MIGALVSHRESRRSTQERGLHEIKAGCRHTGTNVLGPEMVTAGRQGRMSEKYRETEKKGNRSYADKARQKQM